jgi:ribosomal peptide maturation radical SAM protein 1
MSVEILYFNVNYLSKIGNQIHERVSGGDGTLNRLFGELLFSEYLFGRPLNIEKTVTHLLSRDSESVDIDAVIEDVYYAKRHIPTFIDECTESVILRRPRLIGFTSSYYQNCSSLSLATKLKEKINSPIIFGGANCEGQMGRTMLNCFPQIDYICSGDGEYAFMNLISFLLTGKNDSVPKIRGILTRKSRGLDIFLTDPLMNMDDSPIPDFTDYYREIEKNGTENQLQVEIGVESSRGCWWGEVSQCTFCGLNGSTMKYRSKSPERVIAELDIFEKKYRPKLFHFVDNILDPTFFKDFFSKVANTQKDINIFYETKAPLLKKQLSLMKSAGINAIQPGIESLSDVVLDIMKKGTTALENILLLKSCLELGIRVYWNIITGFPGEPKEEYIKMQEIIPLLVHLEPPILCEKFLLSRYSPYFNEPTRYGITNVRPSSIYSKIYPFETRQLQDMCYFFDHDYQDHRDVSSYTMGLQSEVENWKQLWKLEQAVPQLNMILSEKFAIINDTRPCAVQRNHFLFGKAAQIYRICEQPREMESIISCARQAGIQITNEELTSISDDLLENKLCVKINNKFLSLAAMQSKDET